MLFLIIKRKLLIHACVLTLLFASGCAGVAGGGNAARLDELEHETEEMRQHVDEVRENLELLSATLNSLEQSIDQIKDSAERPRRIEEGTKRVSEMLESIDRRLNDIERANPATLNIKVLSSDGDMRSARRIKMLLGKRGYKVKAMDVSGTGAIKVDTVFYSKGYVVAGRQLAEIIGIGARSKLLTWSTVYDIIIVTGAR
jgi:outer membrane murein-binding lipoprotein Lpp